MTDIDVSKYNVTEDGHVLRKMTYEEKAEKIANKKCHKMFCYTNCNVNKNHHCGAWRYNKECALEGIEYGLAERIAELEKENEILKGYKNIVDTIKAEGFETFCEVKMFLQHHKEIEEENKRLKQCSTVNIADK